MPIHQRLLFTRYQATLFVVIVGLLISFSSVASFSQDMASGFFTGITHLNVDTPGPDQLRVNLDGDGPIQYTVSTPDPNIIQLEFPQTRIALDLLSSNGKVKLPKNSGVQQAYWHENPATQTASLRLIGPRLAKKHLMVLGAQPAQHPQAASREVASGHPTNNSTGAFPPEPTDTLFENSTAYAHANTRPPEPLDSTYVSALPPLLSPQKTHPVSANHTSSAFLASEISSLLNGPLPAALEQAQQWVDEHQPDQAIQLLEELTQKYPYHAEIYAVLGELYLSQQHHHSAFQAFKQALHQETASTMQGAYLDRCAAAVYQSPQPFQAYQRLNQLADQFLQVAEQQFFTQLVLGVMAIQTGHTDIAHSHLKQANTLNSHSGEALYYLGLSEELRGQPELARQHYQQALGYAPTLLDAQQGLARLHSPAG